MTLMNVIDGIRKMDNPQVEEIVVPAAGVHIVLPDHFSPDKMGLIVPKTTDGRVLVCVLYLAQ